MQTTYFTIGSSLQGVAFPGESLTRNAEPVKAAMTAPFRMFLGLNGDTLGYFVPTDEWDPINGYGLGTGEGREKDGTWTEEGREKDVDRAGRRGEVVR